MNSVARLLCGLGLLLILQHSWAIADPPGDSPEPNIFDFSKPKVKKNSPAPATAPAAPAPLPPEPTPTPPTPMPEPGVPPATPARTPTITAAQPVKHPVPSASELVASSKLVDDVCAGDIAKATTVEQKVALSAKLLQAGLDEKIGHAREVRAFRRAKDVAVDAGDLVVAMNAIDATDQSFLIDGAHLKSDTANAVAKSPHLDRKTFIEQATAMSDDAQKVDDYEWAKQLDDLALALARQLRDQDANNEVSSQLESVTEARTVYSKVAPAEAVLKTKPRDPDANLKVGRFLCFIKGDWDAGLHNLSAGSDPTLSGLAQQESKNPTIPSEQVLLGDGWWKFAAGETAATKDAAMERSAKWYRTAQPTLKGLTKVKVEKRLADFEKVQATGTHTAHGTVNLLSKMQGDTGRKEGNIVVLKGDERISTDRTFKAPVTFKLVARTDSTNIRVGYAADQIIFNWEYNESELRIDGGPADGRHRKGAGKIPANKWVEITLHVLPDSMSISVDGQPRYETKADFSKVNEIFSVRPASGSVIRIKSLSAVGQ